VDTCRQSSRINNIYLIQHGASLCIVSSSRTSYPGWRSQMNRSNSQNRTRKEDGEKRLCFVAGDHVSASEGRKEESQPGELHQGSLLKSRAGLYSGWLPCWWRRRGKEGGRQIRSHKRREESSCMQCQRITLQLGVIHLLLSQGACGGSVQLARERISPD
jgi:hypothetical protein